MTGTCTKCGNLLPAAVQFCPECGQPVLGVDYVDSPVSQTFSSGGDNAGGDDIVLPSLPDQPMPLPQGSGAGSSTTGGRRRRGRLVAWGAGLLAATTVGAIALVVIHPWSRSAAGGTAASASPATGASSTSGSRATPDASPFATTSTAVSDAVTPSKAPAVADPTSFSDSFNLEVTCPDAGSSEESADTDNSVALDEQLGVSGAYVVVRRGGQLALIDRVEQRVVWCAPLALGSLDGPATVPSESPVGRPGYVPDLNDDTLAAASPTGEGPILSVAQSRLWVLLPVEITRPQIRSQQARNFHAFLAFDDAGTPQWLHSFAEIDSVSEGSVIFRRDDANGSLYRVVGGDRNSAAPTPYLTISSLDASTGTAGRPWVAKGSDRDPRTGRFSKGVFVSGVHRSGDAGETWGVAGWRGDAGTQLFTTAYADSEIDHVVTEGNVVTTRQDPVTRELARAAAIYRLDTGAVSTLRLPFSTDLSDQCTWGGADVLVCDSRDGEASSLAALDIAAHGVRWSWKTGDPDPVTKVPRTVPSEYNVWGRYVYARDPDNKPYLIDVQNGNDLATVTTIAGPQDPYGSVESTDNGLQLTLPQT